MKYNMTICNRQHTYSEKNYTKKKGKEKGMIIL